MKRGKVNSQYDQNTGPPQWFPEQQAYETGPGLYPNLEMQQDYSGYSQPAYVGGYPPQQAAPEFGGFSAVAPAMFNPIAQQFFNDPQMTGMALQYGGNMVEHGAQVVQQKVEHWMSLSRLKYYFAVDNTYVGKKMMLLLFPYAHQEWAVKYDQQAEPVAPRDDVNAPDLYIPTLAFVTYVLVSGLVMGTQARFSPEQLGLQTSSTLGWLMLEVLVLMLARYFLQVSSSLRYLDLVAYCGYKFVGMILCLLMGLVLASMGYYGALVWCSAALAFFLIKTLRLQIQPHTSHHADMMHGNKRRTYLLLIVACVQPLFMWWLTKGIIFHSLSPVVS